MASPIVAPWSNLQARLSALFGVRPGEWRPLLLAFGYFFFLLACYYVLRPLREQFGVANGAANLQYLYTGTFVTMLAIVPIFGKLSAVVARVPLIAGAHIFFCANIFLMYLLFRLGVNDLWVARVFFVWTSVFNLFVVSLFWSFMVDLYRPNQATRLFGVIAAGGSLGAIVGGALVTMLVQRIGYQNLLPIAGTLLLVTLYFVLALNAWQKSLREDQHAAATAAAAARPLGGSLFEGVTLLRRSRYLAGVAVVMLLYTLTTTFLYFEQANLVEGAITDADLRTRYFANINLATSFLSAFIQFFVLGRLIEWLTISRVAIIMPIISAAGLVVLAVSPTLLVVAVLQVLTRAGQFSIMKPVQDMFFSIVSREAKYKTKNVIDTAVYRGGDFFTSWLFATLSRLGASLGALAWLGAAIATAWLVAAYWVGRRFERRQID